MSARHHSTWVRFVALAAIVALMPLQTATAQVNQRDFEGVQSLKAAVEVVQAKLKADGKPEYVDLLSEVRVRAAVATAIKSYEPLLDRAEKQNAGSKEYYLKHVKPVLEKVVDNYIAAKRA